MYYTDIGIKGQIGHGPVNYKPAKLTGSIVPNRTQNKKNTSSLLINIKQNVIGLAIDKCI